MSRHRAERALVILLGLLVVSGAAVIGGVHPASQVGLSLAALVALLLVVILRTAKRGSVAPGAPFWILLGLATVSATQAMLLPPAVHAWLQPKGAALLSYVLQGLAPEGPRALSLDPPASALDGAKLLGFASLAAAVAMLVRDRSRLLLLLWTIDLAALTLGAVAAVQLLLGNDAMYGFFRPETSSRFITPFVNSNHAGGFYAAILFLHLGLSLDLEALRPRLVTLALVPLPVALVIASASRGAIVAAVAGALLLLVLFWRAHRLTGQQLGYSLATALILGTVALPASGTIRREFGRGTRWGAVDEEAKVQVWRDALPMVRDYARVGVGRGAFRTTFQPYMKVTGGQRLVFAYAENLAVQLLVELGPLLLLFLVGVVGLLAWRYLAGVQLQVIHVTALVPILVLLGENLVDFSLEFPGTGFLLVALLGGLAGLNPRRGRGRVATPLRLAGVALWLVFVAGASVAVIRLGGYGVRHDLRSEGKVVMRILLEPGRERAALTAARRAIVHHPADFHLQYLAGQAAVRLPGEQPLRHFNRALYLNPRSAEVHRDTGRALARLDFPDQALAHYLHAIRFGEPLRGPFARALVRAVEKLWDRAEPEDQAIFGASCLLGLASPGLAGPPCLLASRLGRTFRAGALAVVARLDSASGLALAEALRQARKPDRALAAYERLYHSGQTGPAIVSALGDLSMALKDPGAAAYWARLEIARSHRAEAYVRLGRAQWEAGLTEPAERTAAAGLERYPEEVSLVALRAELLIERRAFEPARKVLRGRLVGKPIGLEDEILLMGLQLKVELAEGVRHRVERIRGRLEHLNRLLRSGARGYSVRQEEVEALPRSPFRTGPDGRQPPARDGGTPP